MFDALSEADPSSPAGRTHRRSGLDTRRLGTISNGRELSRALDRGFAGFVRGLRDALYSFA